MPSKTSFINKDVGFPVYAIAWQNDDTILASGGGGAGKFGVKNKIVWICLASYQKLIIDRIESEGGRI